MFLGARQVASRIDARAILRQDGGKRQKPLPMKRPLRQEHLFPLALLAALSIHLLLFWGLPEPPRPPAPGANQPIRIGLKPMPSPSGMLEKTTRPVDNRVSAKPEASPPPLTKPQVQKPAVKKAAARSKHVAARTKRRIAPKPAERINAATGPARLIQPEPASPAVPSAPEPPERKTAEQAAAPPGETSEPPGPSIGDRQAGTGSAALETTSPPSLLQPPNPVYPPLARRMGWQGKVLLRLTVEPDGRVGRVEVEKTSGFPLLDRSARNQVRSWRFQPAKQGGVPVRGDVLLPVVFALRKG